MSNRQKWRWTYFRFTLTTLKIIQCRIKRGRSMPGRQFIFYNIVFLFYSTLKLLEFFIWLNLPLIVPGRVHIVHELFYCINWDWGSKLFHNGVEIFLRSQSNCHMVCILQTFRAWRVWASKNCTVKLYM